MTDTSRSAHLSGLSPSAAIVTGGLWLAWHGWRAMGHAADRLATWHERARERQTLASLDDRMLQDIGLTRDQLRREASKSFWEA